MAQVSSVDSDYSARREAEESHPASPASSTDEGKKKSLLSKVKDKAKGTVRKITGKGTKDRPAGQEVETESDGEVEGSDVQSSSSKGDPSLASDGTKDGVKDGLSPQGNPEGDMLSTFARSDGSENSPLVAEPTTYSDGRGSVDAVMPSPVIEPTSASELGEQSSQNLGEIPEAKEDEKTAAKEVLEGGQDSDTGFKRTFNQKDLQAIDGLPKPGGFDLHNESSVKSNFSVSDSGVFETTDFADEAQPRETEPRAEGAIKGRDREYLPEGLKSVDSETPHPPGTDADFGDSMFSSKFSSDINPNEPAAGEAQHANEIGTWSRGDETQAKESESIGEGTSKGDDREYLPDGLKSVDAETPHPPGTDADFGDSMFSSKFSSDMNPNEPAAGEALHANEIGTWSRGDETQSEEPKPLSRGVDTGSTEPSVEGSEESRQHPPAADSSLHENMFSSAIASDLKPDITDGSSSTSAKEEASTPVQGGAVRGAFEDTKEQDVPTEKGENEDFYDAVSDDEKIATQRSIDTKSGKDFEPAATDEEVPATPSFNPEEPEKEVSEDPKDSSHTEQSSSSLTSSFMSVVGALGGKVSQYTSYAQTPATEKDSPSTTEKEGTAGTT